MARPRGSCPEEHVGGQWFMDQGRPRGLSATCTKCRKKKHWAEFTYSSKDHSRGHNRSDCKQCVYDASEEAPTIEEATEPGEALSQVLTAIVKAQQNYAAEMAELRQEVAALRQLWET